MKMITIHKIQELLQEKQPTNKHFSFFQDRTVFSYPDIWYGAWLEGLQRYLQLRLGRRS